MIKDRDSYDVKQNDMVQQLQSQSIYMFYGHFLITRLCKQFFETVISLKQKLIFLTIKNDRYPNLQDLI